MKLLARKFTLPLIAIAGLIVAIIIVKSQPAMKHQFAEKTNTAVKVISAKRYDVPPQVSGFGEVTPDILLEGKSEISGKVVYVHPQLKPGAILPKDTVVLKIEENDYQLALKKALADLSVSQANLVELEINLKDAKADLVLAKQRLSLSEKELKRSQDLIKRGSISQSKFDSQQSNTLQLKREVQTLKSQLATLPSQRDVLQAKEVIAQSNVKTQERNIERTVIRLPFTARISEESVENNQFIAQGTVLFKAQNINRVLINAQFPFEQFRKVSRGFPADINVSDIIQMSSNTESIFTRLDLNATIKLSGHNGVVWDGKVERFLSNLDPSSRTLGIIVSVDNPYEDINPGVKPPLLAGMFTEVILKGAPRTYVVIPRDALHEKELYVVDQNMALMRKTIVAEVQGAMLLVEQGIDEGEKIITSDVFPAVNGMPLTEVLDTDREQQISTWLREQ